MPSIANAPGSDSPVTWLADGNNTTFALGSVRNDGGVRRYVWVINESGADIAAGDWVTLDLDGATQGTSGFAVELADSDTRQHAMGVADTAMANGKCGWVQVSGPRASCNVADAVAAGDPLKMSSTAGRADAATVGTHHVIGWAVIDGTAANTSTVWIQCG